MTDEQSLIKATKSKGRSASVCFSSRCDRRAVVSAECFDAHTTSISPPLTPPLPLVVAAAEADAAATSGDEMKHFRKRRPASRSQSVRVSGGKSLRRRTRPLDGDVDLDADDGRNHNARIWAAALSDPKLYGSGGEDSSSEICTSSSSWRQSSGRQSNSNLTHHSQYHSRSNRRKCTDVDANTFSNVHKTCHRPVDDTQSDVNSYRLRSFSFTAKGLINRGDSFKRRHSRRSSISANKCEEGTEIGSDIATKEAALAATNTKSGATCGADSESSNTANSTYNVSVMGATGVGKTSLISQFMTSECINPYDRDRDEPCQQTVSILLNGEESELCFHEMKHSKVFRQKYAATAADAFLVLYSVVDKSTFQYAESELVKLQDSNVLHNKPAILVGNKIDLARSRAVSSQDGKCLACTFRVKHLEISVGINHNVDELLVGILHQIRLKKHRCDCKHLQTATVANRWYKNRTIIRASMKARQMFTWMFGREDSKFRNCENLHTL